MSVLYTSIAVLTTRCCTVEINTTTTTTTTTTTRKSIFADDESIKIDAMHRNNDGN